MGGEGPYAGPGKTLTSQASGLGPSSPAKSGEGLRPADAARNIKFTMSKSRSLIATPRTTRFEEQ